MIVAAPGGREDGSVANSSFGLMVSHRPRQRRNRLPGVIPARAARVRRQQVPRRREPDPALRADHRGRDRRFRGASDRGRRDPRGPLFGVERPDGRVAPFSRVALGAICAEALRRASGRTICSSCRGRGLSGSSRRAAAGPRVAPRSAATPPTSPRSSCAAGCERSGLGSLSPGAGTAAAAPPAGEPATSMMTRAAASRPMQDRFRPSSGRPARQTLHCMETSPKCSLGEGSSRLQRWGRPDLINPRGCGEQTFDVDTASLICGSSPRVRGTGSGKSGISCGGRFIPAGAGNR